MKLFFSVLFSMLFCISCHTEEVEISDAHISVYPNPFHNSVFINVQAQKETKLEVSIYGKLDHPEDDQVLWDNLPPDENPVIKESLSATDNNNYEITAAGWKSGTYIMDVTVNGRTERYNLIKE
ncbi:MAG: hypothetical protein ABJH98_03475 [Reichenbachiella sp.]|uniref:hypothetical protein n=1 Tax=Reichenbachiella sp. TaxID=2184521 RepID=UPI003299B524